MGTVLLRGLMVRIGALITLAGQPVLASQTVCTFESAKASRYYELEFIGDGYVKPMIVFASTTFSSGKRVTLQAADYTLKHFDPGRAAVLLEFRNPGSTAWPPSFTLSGRRGRATLQMGSRGVGGTFRCGD